MGKGFKVFLGIVVVVAVACPYFAGRAIEKDFNNVIAKLNETSKQDYTIVGKYSRGYFSSTATTEVTFKNSYAALQFSHIIKHGPVIFDFNGWFSPSTYIPRAYKLGIITTQVSGQMQKMLDKIYSGKNGYSCITSISLQGDIDTTLETLPFETAIEKGSLKWQGSMAEIKTNKKLEKIDVAVAIPQIEYTEQASAELKQSAVINNIKQDVYIDIHNDDMRMNFTVDGIKVTSNDKVEIELKNYKLDIDKKVVNNLIDFNLTKKFTSLALDADNYGPFDFNVTVKNLNAKVMREIMLQLDSESNLDAIAQQSILDLLANRISMNAVVKFTTPDGNLDGSIKAEVGGPGITAATREQVLATVNASQNWLIAKKIVYKLLMQFAMDQIQHREIMYYLQNQTSTIKNPYTLTPDEAQKVISDWMNKLIAQLVAQNIIVVKEDNVVIDMGYAANIITVNGTVKTETDLQQLQPLFEVITPPPATSAPSSVPAPNTTLNPNVPAPENTTPNTIPAPAGV